MPSKNVIGYGNDAQGAADNANDLCDQWISDQTTAGHPVHEDNRTATGPTPETPGSNIWIAQTTLVYH
jgi:hypothetical protein